MLARLFTLLILITLAACVSPQEVELLQDHDIIPVGSRITFWVYMDDDGWKESNIHIAYLPRPMTGAEARHWAQGVGNRDAGDGWTHYYVLTGPPGGHGKSKRSAVTQVRPSSHTPTARLHPIH